MVLIGNPQTPTSNMQTFLPDIDQIEGPTQMKLRRSQPLRVGTAEREQIVCSRLKESPHSMEHAEQWGSPAASVHESRMQ